MLLVDQNKKIFQQLVHLIFLFNRFECLPRRDFNALVSLMNKSVCEPNCCFEENPAKWSPDRIRCYYATGTQTKKDRSEKVKIGSYKISANSDINTRELTILENPYKNWTFANDTEKPNAYPTLYVKYSFYSKWHMSVCIAAEIATCIEETTFGFLGYKEPTTNVSRETLVVNITESSKDEDFYFKISRKNSSVVLFHTKDTPLLFNDKFIEFTTQLPNDYIYGFGSPSEKFRRSLIKPQKLAVFSQYPPVLNLTLRNWYGSHPFFLGLDGDESGYAYGVLLANHNPSK